MMLPVLPFPEESVIVVPLPSSKFQYPTSPLVGEAANTEQNTKKDSRKENIES